MNNPTRVLSPEVSAKIAAGEVVERPASVVKELIENSLDAGASNIHVKANDGGLSLINVIDDGTGISAQEVEIAFERHATSKVVGLDDLESIATLGFRGEALPSIAAVSRVNFLTKIDGDLSGTNLVLDNGIVIEKKQKGCPRGTSVIVQELFSKVPARLKFLKSKHTENSHISNIVTQYSLAFTNVRFVLDIDGRTVLRTPGNGSLRDTLVEVYGVETVQEMREVYNDESDGSLTKISGYISLPSLTRSNRNYLSFFINHRWVKSHMLNYALEEAYHGLLMVGKHPIAVINISLPYSDVDVNVHPAKTEVRFRQEGIVFTAVQKSVRSSLTGSISVPTMNQSNFNVSGSVRVNIPSARRPKIFNEQVSIDSRNSDISNQGALPVLHVIGQIANTYIIAEGPDGVSFIDQHAAHERILYEQIKEARSQRSIEIQGLLELLTVELTPRQEQQMKLRVDFLSEFGFSIEQFGERTYVIRSIPAMLNKQNIIEVVIALLDSDEAIADLDDNIAKSLACHGAIKAGQLLNVDEMRNLIGQLEKTAQPYTCPHGRPTIVCISTSQLEKNFGRT